MRLYIQASELLLEADEVRSRIPSEKLSALEGRGVIRAYRLAHEGTSQPKVLTEGSKVLRWVKAVVHRLTQKIQAGTKFFVGHGDGTNSHEGRRTVGEVLASFVKDIGGKVSSVVIGHFPDESSIKDMDVCSMEADVEIDGDVVSDVNSLTGIALGNSRTDSPAFPGATMLSTLQCFDQNKPGEGENMADEKKITFDDVKRSVREMNIFPHQLFTIVEMKADREFGPIIEQRDKLSTENEGLTKKIGELETSSKDALRKGEVAEATTILDKRLADGMTDKQKAFIKSQFDPTKLDDLTESGVDKFVEQSIKDFAATAKLFGVAEDDIKIRPGTDGKKTDDSTDAESLEDQALELVLGKRD